MKDEMKAIRQELKKTLAKAGVKANVKKPRGTSYNPYTYVNKPKGKNEWSKKEMNVLENDFNINIGHPSNQGALSNDEIFASVGGYKNKKFKSKPAYQMFKQDFIQTALKQHDSGTCCLGAGTIVKKGKTDIDFIDQLGQADTRNIVAEKIMEKRAKKLGLSFQHESGRMD